MDETKELKKYFYKDIEKNATHIEKLNIDVAVLAKQYETIQKTVEGIEEKVDKIEKEKIKEEGNQEAKKNIFEYVVKYWWLIGLTICGFVANDPHFMERIKNIWGG